MRLSQKDLDDLSKGISKPIRFYHRTAFWENVKKTIAIFSAPATAGVHYAGGSDFWVIFTGTMGFVGAVLAIWVADSDRNGLVDLLE